jgi:hypothetical protein
VRTDSLIKLGLHALKLVRHLLVVYLRAVQGLAESLLRSKGNHGCTLDLNSKVRHRG